MKTNLCFNINKTPIFYYLGINFLNLQQLSQFVTGCYQATSILNKIYMIFGQFFFILQAKFVDHHNIIIMFVNQVMDLPEFPEKGNPHSNSTIDEDSRHEGPFTCWQPFWTQPNYQDKPNKCCNICPGCSKIVALNQHALMCESLRNYRYLAHNTCAADIFQCTEHVHTAYQISKPEFMNEPASKIGCREYLMSLSIEHPISPVKLYSGVKKLLEHNQRICFTTTSKNNSYFEPNHIVLPMAQFKCFITVKALSSAKQSVEQLRFRVDLSKLCGGIHYIGVQQGQLSFVAQFEIIKDRNVKAEIVDAMNYKYRKSFADQQFVKLNKFYLNLRSSRKQLSLDIPELNDSFRRDSFRSQNQCESIGNLSPDKLSPVKPSKLSQKSEEKPSQYFGGDEKLLTYIKTQMGSKQFQKKARSYKKSQIDEIITQILPNLEEVVLHHYANYMFQSLLRVCNFEQRVRIIQSLGEKIAQLVCHKQGTFVFQELIDLHTHEEEFQLICNSILQNFRNIALDNEGFHFLRKLFEKMPAKLFLMFAPQVHQKFVELSKSKNAVFVVQCVLSGLKAYETQTKQVCLELKRFLEDLALNTPKLINNEFGNYVIQKSFEIIEAQRLEGVFDYIIKSFQQYSCEKISSNVVVFCLTRCWKKNSNYFITLKNSLDKKSIRAMYHNKEGNRVLLEVMELNCDIGLKDRINETIRNEQASKFNNRRWVTVTGKCKTGAVGTNYNSFSEAHTFTKRKNYN